MNWCIICIESTSLVNANAHSKRHHALNIKMSYISDVRNVYAPPPISGQYSLPAAGQGGEKGYSRRRPAPAGRPREDRRWGGVARRTIEYVRPCEIEAVDTRPAAINLNLWKRCSLDCVEKHVRKVRSSPKFGWVGNPARIRKNMFFFSLGGNSGLGVDK